MKLHTTIELSNQTYTMNKRFITIICTLFVLLMGVLSNASAQSSGDLYQGLTRGMPDGRTVVPYGLEVTFDKTTHLIFPAPIRYVDLGSANIVAGKAESAENVLRVKASVRDFETETNMAVICNDGSYYAFNVKYADEPEKLSLEMVDFLHAGEGNLPSNKADIYFKELGSETPTLVRLLMSTIHKQNKRLVKHIAAKQFGMRFALKGIYSHNGLLYFHIATRNSTNMRYPIDYITFKVVDKAVAKQTAIQERVVQPLRAYNDLTMVAPKSELRTVYALASLSLPEGKVLEVTLHELNGGRTLSFTVENKDLVRAQAIDDLTLRF